MTIDVNWVGGTFDMTAADADDRFSPSPTPTVSAVMSACKRYRHSQREQRNSIKLRHYDYKITHLARIYQSFHRLMNHNRRVAE